MIDISFLLPTNRPYDSLAINIVNSIYEHRTDYSFEVLVYSQFDVDDNRIIHVKEYEQCGVWVAYNVLSRQSKGQYLFILNDDHIPQATIYNTIPFLEQLQHPVKLTALAPVNQDDYATAMPILNNLDIDNEQLPIELRNEKYLEPNFRYPVLGFPVLQRSVVASYLNGYIFHPKLRNYFGDNWISFFIGEKYGKVAVCKGTQPTSISHDYPRSQCYQQDKQTFFDLACKLLRGECPHYVENTNMQSTHIHFL